MRTLRYLVAFTALLIAAPTWAQLEKAKAPTSAETNKNALIELPDNQEVPASRRVVIIAAKTAGAEVKWIVLNTNPLTPVESLELANSKSLLLFPNDQEDTIVVLAYTLVDGKLSDPVRHLCRVVKAKPDPAPDPTPNPTPNPTPTPTPTPKAKAAHITFVIDQSKQTPEIGSITTDQGIRGFAVSIGAHVHVVSPNSASVTKGGLIEGVNAAGGPPCVIVQDAAGNIIGQQRLVNVAATQQFLQPYQGR